jgi:hypothetical protein
MSWGMIIVGAVGAGVSIYNASKNRGLAEDQATEAERLQAEQQGKLDAQKAEYKEMTFENPFADMKNVYAENVYEDLTVNQQQAQFQAQQGAQQRSNIMQGLKGAAGASGVAGLAQAMAGQGQLQTQRISASIGMQESQQQQLKAKGALQVQQGEAGVQTAKMQGEQWVQQSEMNRQATLLGMQMGETSGANLASSQAQANQMNAQIAQTQAVTDAFGFATQAAGAYTDTLGKKKAPDDYSGWDDMGAGANFDPSDRKLKKNIKKIGESPSGLNIYSFEFKDSKYGEGLFQGVMSDEVLKKVVTRKDGYDMVDYSKLDVEFKQI